MVLEMRSRVGRASRDTFPVHCPGIHPTQREHGGLQVLSPPRSSQGFPLTWMPFVANMDDNMAREFKAVVEELGGKETLRRTLTSEQDLRDAIREGFPVAVVEELMQASGLTLKEIAESLDLSPRSLQRRRQTGRLARHESDRLYRLARIIAIAEQFLGDRQRALRWLKRPNRALGGASPIEVLDTEPGARQVEKVLGRIAYGGIS